MYASEKGHLECMKYLISAGANVSQGDKVFMILVDMARLYYIACDIGWHDSAYVCFVPKGSCALHRVFDQCWS